MRSYKVACVHRKIIHIDLDCFYAAVEVRDNPNLRCKPVAVGGAADKRGVLTTCNYEARTFGLHSAMASARALQLCPALILLPVNMDKYRAVSAKIHDIFRRYTAHIEPLSLDEAYLDASNSTAFRGSATLLAQQIRADILKEAKLTASAGIAPNKFLAKVASDWHKPNGQCSIPPARIATFIESLPVKKIPGVGKVCARKLQARGITTCAELQALSQIALQQQFGKFGARLYGYCRGIDERPLETARMRKSLSVERTFLEDLATLLHCENQLPQLQKDLYHRLKKHSTRVIHKQFIKIKFADFSRMTKECVVTQVTDAVFLHLLREALHGNTRKIRLIGIGVRFQQPLFTSQMQAHLL